MKAMYGPLNKLGKFFAIPLSFIVSNRVVYQLFTLIKIYLAVLLGQGAGTGWSLKAETECAYKVIKKRNKGDNNLVIFDVGANKGEWSYLISKKNINASFFLFEPQTGCHPFIIEKHIPNMRLFPLAVSSLPNKKVDLFSTSNTAGLASIYVRRDTYFQSLEFNKFNTMTTTIDKVISDNNLDFVDFIKMDIEGHELEALKGASNCLQMGKIHAIAFEFGSGNINSRTYFHDFWDLLAPLGYQFFRILPWGGLMPIREYSEDLEYLRGATNYLVVKEDSIDDNQ